MAEGLGHVSAARRAIGRHAGSRGVGRRGAAWALVLVCAVAVLAGCVPPPDPGTTTTTQPGETTTTEPGSTTTVPDTTTTVPDTTTTVPDTTTTTTTVVEPEPEASYDFGADAAMLTEPGQSVDVVVGGVDPSGQPNDDPAPAETTYEVLGDTGAFDITDLEGGGMRVTSTGQVGGIVVSARVPGQDLAVATEVFSAVPAAGVQVVPDTQVVYPVPNLAKDADPTAVRNEHITESGPGGFGWAELAERVELPTGGESDLPMLVDGEGSDETDDEFDDPESVIVPFVLRGPLPAVGTRLLSAGGGGLAGEVVERAGLPNVQRGDYALVSVRTSALTDLYEQVRWDIDPEAVTAAGIVPESISVQWSCADEVDADDCPDPEQAPVQINVAQPTAPRMGRAAGPVAPTRAVTLPTAVSAGAARAQAGSACKDSWKSSILQVKAGPKDFNFTPVNNVAVILGSEDPTVDRIYFAVGYHAELVTEISGKIQAAFTVSTECLMKEIGHVDIPIPAGPAAALLSIRVKAQIVGLLGLDLEGGPELTFKQSCTFTHWFRLGFQLKYDPVSQRRLGDFELLDRDERNRECDLEPDFASSLGFSEGGMSAKVGMKFGAGLKIPLGLQVGGKLSGAWQRLLNDPNAGFFELVSVTAGPRLSASVESETRSLQRRNADSHQRLELFTTGKVGGSTFERISTGLGLPPKMLGNQLVAFDFMAGNLPLLSLHEPVRAGSGHTVDVTVDGEAVDGTAEVVPGDVLAVSSALERPSDGPEPQLEGAGVWLERSVGYDEIEEFTLTASGLTLEGQLTITPQLCDTIGNDETDLVLLGETLFAGGTGTGGSVYVPAYGGAIPIRCLEPAIEFDRESVSFGPDQVTFPATVHLQGDLLAGEQWRIDGDTVPSWLTANPTEGWFRAGEQSDSVPVGMNVDCANVAPRREVSATIRARVDTELVDDPLTAELLVEADCRRTSLDLDPTVIEAPGSGGTYTVAVDTFGPYVVYWEAAGQSGIYNSGRTSSSFQIDVPAKGPSCFPTSTSYQVLLRTEPRVEGDTTARGSAEVTVNQGPGPKSPNCKPPPRGGGWGDPHIVTFDGARYDAQTFGEYWYVLPLEDGPDVEVQTRHEAWHQTGSGTTIITGMAARIGGHTVEITTRGSAAPQTMVMVDGRTVDLAEGSTLQIAAGLTIGMADGRWFVESPDVSIDVVRWDNEDILNVWVSMPEGSQVAGLLGTPDGDPLDDLRTRDGESFTLRQVRLHGEELLDLSSSWRVTERSDSLFTESYAGFDDPVSLFDVEMLDEHRAAAQAYLDGIDVVCDVPQGDDHDYVVDSIAVERLAGTPAALQALSTCTYSVTGRAASQLPTGAVVGVEGLSIRLTSDRLAECEVVTGWNGSFTCTMTAKAPGDLPAEGGAPFEVDLRAAWPGRSGSVLETTVEFDELAPMGGAPLGRSVELDVDADELVRADITGSFIADLDGEGAAPVAGPVPLRVRGLDADGVRLVELRERVTPAADGSFSLSRHLPGGVTTVELVAEVGTVSADHPTTTASVEPGANEISFVVDHRPPLAEISGTLTGPAGPLGETYIRVVPTPAPGEPGLSATSVRVVPASGGAYRAVVVLPEAAVGYTATAQVGVATSDHRSVVRDSLQPGLNAAELSVHHDPPVLRASGRMTGAAGAPITTGTVVTVNAFDPSDELLRRSTVVVTPDGNGDYSFDHVLPVATTHVVLVADVGVISADDPTIELTGLSAGVQARTFDVDYDPPRIAASGVLLDGAGVPRPATGVRLHSFDADGDALAVRNLTAHPAAVTGAYTLPAAQVPSGTVRAELEYLIGAIPADHVRLTIDPVLEGLNERVFDIDQRSTSVLVEGSLRTNGGVALGATTVRMTAFEGDTELGHWDHYVLPSLLGGQFGLRREVPRAATRVVLEARVGVTPTDWVRQEYTDLRVGPNQVRFDVEYLSTWIDIDGEMVGIDTATGVHGPLTGDRFVALRALDADGDEVYTDGATVRPNPVDGSYTLSIRVPRSTASVVATAHVGIVPNEYPEVPATVTVGVRNRVDLYVDYRPTVLVTSGTIRVGGVPYSGPVDVAVTERTGGDVVTTRTTTATAASNGAYSAEHIARLVSDNARVTVTPRFASGAARSVDVAELNGGRQAVPITINSNDTVLEVSGHPQHFGQAATSGRFEVLTWNAANQQIELEEGGYFVDVVPNGPNGAYTVQIPLRADVASAVLRTELPEPGVGPIPIASHSFTVRPNQVSTATWNTNGAWVELDLTLRDDGVPYTGDVQSRIHAYGEDGTVLDLQGPVYLSPDGQGTAAAFVSFPSVGTSGVVPDRVDVELFGYGDGDRTRTHVVHLDRGASIYRQSLTMELATEPRQITVYGPAYDGTTLTVTPYWIPGQGTTLVERDSATSHEVQAEEWNGFEATVTIDVPVSATHLGVRIEQWDVERIVELSDDDPVYFSIPVGGEELVVRGTATVTGGFGCGPYAGRAVPFRLSVFGVLDGDESGWTSAYMVDDQAWVVPNEDGTWTYRTWLNGTDTIAAWVEAQSPAIDTVGSAYQQVFVNPDAYSDAQIELAAWCNVW